MPLSEKEKKELEMLDNPDVEFTSPLTGLGLLFGFFSSNRLAQRKERVVALRTKMRMDELHIDPRRDWQQRVKILREEEERFDDRFKDQR